MGICSMRIPTFLRVSPGSGSSARLIMALIPNFHKSVKASSDSGYDKAASFCSTSQLKWGRTICVFSSSVRSYSRKNLNGLFKSCLRKAGSKFARTLIWRNTSMDIYPLSCFLTITQHMPTPGYSAEILQSVLMTARYRPDHDLHRCYHRSNLQKDDPERSLKHKGSS